MKKIFSIVLALGLVLTMGVMSAVPAAAVSAPITVSIVEPLAYEVTDYTIRFHNDGTLEAGIDFIDVMFPYGTVVTGFGTVTVTKGPSRTTDTTTPVTIAMAYAIGLETVRIWIGTDIEKCEYVRIVIEDITNPGSCYHHLQVGTSTHTPVASNEYAIYSIKMCLEGGPYAKNLISLPSYPEDESIEVVLADLFFYVAYYAGSTTPFDFSVWYWDAEAHEWLIYASDTSFDQLDTIEPGKAYWIKCSFDVCFYFKGVDYPEDQGPPVKFCHYVRSWNMVGFVSLTDIYASEYLKYTMLPWPQQTTSAVIAIYSWDQTLGWVDEGWWPSNPAFVIGGLHDVLLTSGEGYFMAFLDGACIIPPIQ